MQDDPTLSRHHPIRRVRTVLAAALALLLAVAVGPASGQEAGSDDPGPVTWGISPAGPEGRDTRSVIDLVVEPGATIVEHVVIDNYGEEPLAVDLYAADARPADGAFDVAAADEPARGVGAWVEPAEARVVIPGRDRLLVELTIRVPVDASPGDHAGGVLASRRAAGEGPEVGIETERRVGARIHLRVAGPAQPELSVRDLDVRARTSMVPFARSDLRVGYVVANEGNLRLDGAARVTVRGPFGLGRRTVEGPAVEDLLPGHQVTHAVDVHGVLPLGPLTVEVEVVPTASAGQTLSEVLPGAASTTVWALPFGTVALIVVLALLALVWRLRARRRSREPVEARSG